MGGVGGGGVAPSKVVKKLKLMIVFKMYKWPQKIGRHTEIIKSNYNSYHPNFISTCLTFNQDFRGDYTGV